METPNTFITVNTIFLSRLSQPITKYQEREQKNQGLWVEEGTRLLQNPQTMINHSSQSYTIKQLALAFNDTLVIHTKEKQDKIIHIDKLNKTINSLTFICPTLFFQMLSPKIVLIVLDKFQPSICQIIQWNLQHNTQNKITYYKKGQNYLLKLLIFPKSELFCIVEGQVPQNQHQSDIKKRRIQTLHLIYYRYTLNSDQTKNKPILRTKMKTNKTQDLSNVKIFKLNQFSMIGWVGNQPNKYDNTEILIHKINQLGQDQWSIHCFQTGLNLQKHHLLWQITNIWEIDSQQLYVNIRTELDIINIKALLQKDQINLLELPDQNNYNFIWQYKNNKTRSPKFRISKDHRLRIVGRHSTTHEKYYKQNLNIAERIKQQFGVYVIYKAQLLPIFYVDLLNERILAIQQFLKNQLTIRDVLFFNFSTMQCFPDIQLQARYFQIQAMNYNGKTWKRCHTKLKIKKLQYIQYPVEQIIAFWMLNIIQQCDQDLILEIIKLRSDEIF